MAFVSGGGGGLPPQAGPAVPGSANGSVQTSTASFPVHHQLSALPGTSHFLDSMFRQQQQQEQQPPAVVGSTHSQSSQLVSHLLASALLSGPNSLAVVNQLTNNESTTIAESQRIQLLSILQDQFALGQMLPQFQGGHNLNAIGPIVNPAIALYYQQVIQQQQQQNVLQQLVQQPLSQSQTVLLQQTQFQSPVQVPSGNVDLQLNAQERLMNAYINGQQQHSVPFNVLSGDHDQTLMNYQVASVNRAQHAQRQHDSASCGAIRSSVGAGSNADEESVEEKISRLISENEAIVQPNQTLLKRRPYHRQAAGQPSIDHDSNSAGEYGCIRTSPGLRNHRMFQSASRSQPQCEPILNAKSSFGGSLTSGLPLNRNIKQEFLPTCSFCLLTFPNEAGLQVHEFRCSRKVDAIHSGAEKFKVDSTFTLQSATKSSEADAYSRHPLKRRLLAAVSFEQQSPKKSSRPESTNEAANDLVVVDEQEATVAEMKDASVEIDGCRDSSSRRITTVSINLDQQQSHFVAAPVAVSSMVQQVYASVPLCAIQIAASSSTFASPTCTNYVPLPTEADQCHRKEENPFSIEGRVLDGNTEKPYTLVLTHSCKVQSSADLATVRRSRGRNITSETFVCMHRAQPMFVEQKGNLSMYSNWQQVSINEAESKLNLLYMGMCSTRPRTGVKPFWRYSVANRDHGQYKMTHSSFWEYRNKMRRQTDQVNDVDREQEALHSFVAHEQDTKPAVDEADDVGSSKLRSQDSGVAETSEELAPVIASANFISMAEETRLWKIMKKQDPVIGGHRTDEIVGFLKTREKPDTADDDVKANAANDDIDIAKPSSSEDVSTAKESSSSNEVSTRKASSPLEDVKSSSSEHVAEKTTQEGGSVDPNYSETILIRRLLVVLMACFFTATAMTSFGFTSFKVIHSFYALVITVEGLNLLVRSLYVTYRIAWWQASRSSPLGNSETFQARLCRAKRLTDVLYHSFSSVQYALYLVIGTIINGKLIPLVFVARLTHHILQMASNVYDHFTGRTLQFISRPVL
ncbi:hypothetical protein GCK32_008526 [Trichostrongylus colubriformis]|uniref:Uncharacterized protein n=1 Tax=Trichostrongylus colubriformis TaxID=6319 RepID=A0AAN8FG38_TRICO